MRNQFLQILDNIEQSNVMTAPGYVTMLAMARHPNVKYPKPEMVAVSIPINVDASFTGDKELFDRTIEVYVDTLNKIWVQLCLDFSFVQAEPLFMKMVGSMSLTYKA